MYSADSLYDIFENELASRLKMQKDCPNIYQLFVPHKSECSKTRVQCFKCGARCYFTFVICSNCSSKEVSCEQHQAQVKKSETRLAFYSN
jgi:hypothetical protein